MTPSDVADLTDAELIQIVDTISGPDLTELQVAALTELDLRYDPVCLPTISTIN